MDKYKQYVEIQWWNGIEKRDIENWLRNFETSKDIAKIILDNIIFYNESQMKTYTRFLVNKLKEQLYERIMKENNYKFCSDEIIWEEWERYKSQTIFMPAAVRGDTTSSAYKVIRHWRSILMSDGEAYSDISDIDSKYKLGVRRFVLVDDFSGSGKQMKDVLEQKIMFKGEWIEIGKLMDVADDIEVVVAVYVLHERAKHKLNELFPQVKIIYVDLINEKLNYLNKDASIYSRYNEHRRIEIVHEIQRISDEIANNDEKMRGIISSYVLNIPVVFSHGCPNNTLILLFAHSDNWQQLFKRGSET